LKTALCLLQPKKVNGLQSLEDRTPLFGAMYVMRGIIM